MNADSIDNLVRNHPIYLNITVHYIRPKQSTFARDTFQSIIREVIDSIDLDLETDPTLVCTHIKSLMSLIIMKVTSLPYNYGGTQVRGGQFHT